MDFQRYTDDFENALKATDKLGFNVDGSDSRFMNEDELVICQALTIKTVHDNGVKAVALRCQAIHTALRQILQTESPELNPILTVGWVKVRDESWFETTVKRLKREIRLERKRKRSSSAPVDMHVWITMRDAGKVQLVDVSLPVYLCWKGRISEPVAWLFDSDSPEEHHFAVEYYPLLAGREVLAALGTVNAE